MKKRHSGTASVTPARHRILLVDDHPFLRMGLAEVLNRERDLRVCGAVESAEEALTAVEKLRPDVVLADLNLPGKCGLELIKDLASVRPSLPVIVLSMHDEEMYAGRCIRAGARGYMTKGEDPGKLASAIRHVIAGGIHVSENVSARFLMSFSGRLIPENKGLMGKLSDRELEVLQWIGHGATTAKIANRLHLSIKTIESHRAKIKAKLGLSTTPKLIAYAARWADSGD